MFINRFISSAFLVVLLSNMTVAQKQTATKKLIEFGWDYPTVTDLKSNIHEIENTPFDGVCFSIDKHIYTAFDNTAYPDAKFQFNNLTGIPWQKFTDNFLIVRGASLSGPHWLDDKSWTIISKNLQKVSKAVSLTGAVGIAFDPEYYFKDSTSNPWIYKPEYYNNLSYDAVGSYVRKRGKQFMEAIQTYKPDIKILCFWLLGWVWDQQKTRPVEKTAMALFPFFIDGMLEGQNNSSEIIDGNESSYWYQSFIPFVTVGGYIRGIESSLIERDLRDKYKKISVAESVFLDGLYVLSPRYDKGFDNETKSRWLRDNLYFAFKTSDEYVWFYDERVNWWQNQVDSGVTEIIAMVKNSINSEFNNHSQSINGQSTNFNFKKIQPDNYHGFSFDYEKSQNTLQVKLADTGINNIQIYTNSFLIYNEDNPSTTLTIDLNGKYNGDANLIVISKNNRGVYSVAFIN